MSRRPHVIREPEELARYVSKLRRGRVSIGFVPTMGALHDGHISLMQQSYEDNDRTIVSVYVNPLQFGPHEDLERYPRDLESDVLACQQARADVVFAPGVAVMQPPGRSTSVHVEGLSHDFEGARRPGHFDGVATIVAKLFNMVRPDRAYFGQKDYQQTVVVRRMVEDLSFPVEVVVCPIVRDDDGLALSSRNRYLSEAERAVALRLPRALLAVREAVREGETDAAKLRNQVADALGRESEIDTQLEYADIVHPESLGSIDVLEGEAVLVAAFRVGATRLLDNVRLVPRGSGVWE